MFHNANFFSLLSIPPIRHFQELMLGAHFISKFAYRTGFLTIRLLCMCQQVNKFCL